jgi:hypothetical protein
VHGALCGVVFGGFGGFVDGFLLVLYVELVWFAWFEE